MKIHTVFSAMLALLYIFTTNSVVFAQANQSPVIAVWYESDLKFGYLGNPQKHINIMGNVRDPDGSVSSLTYRLNGGSSVSLEIGPNSNIRLINPGDFNASIPVTSLNPGSNSVVLTAVDNSGSVRTKTITVSYTSNQVWPLPYSTNWASAGSIMDQAQIVDGAWSLSPDGIRPTAIGYDRVIAIGDISWTNYEILVPITTRGFYPDPANPGDAGGIGIVARWQGHTGSGQPPTNWDQLGAYGYYSKSRNALTMRLNRTEIITQNYAFKLNVTYLYKLRVESDPQGGRYSFKIWEQAQPEPAWNSPAFANIVNIVDSSSSVPDLRNGSMLLVAHRADATFGNVTICPLSLKYALSVSTSGSGTVNAQPGKTSYNCGEGVTLSAQPDTGWIFSGWSGDIAGSSDTISFNVTRPLSISANFAFAQDLPFKINIPSIARE